MSSKVEPSRVDKSSREHAANGLIRAGQGIGGSLRALPRKTVHKFICALLILWLLIQLLGLLKLFVPSLGTSTESSTQTLGTSNSISTSSRENNPVRVNQLQALNLFGIAGAKSTAVVTKLVPNDIGIKASKTKLKLFLQGVAFSADDAESLAMIVFQGKQEQYRSGDALPAGRNVVLSRVLRDHILLDNNGRYESLWLYDNDKKQAAFEASSNPKRKPTDDRRDQEQASSLAKDYRQRLYKKPSSLAEVLKVSPVQGNGSMIGYRVSPGRDRKQFAQLGFKPGDIVTNINQVALDKPSKALQVYKLMRSAKEASFTVLRDGDEIQIMVSLDDS